jgi:hypothetical protein
VETKGFSLYKIISLFVSFFICYSLPQAHAVLIPLMAHHKVDEYAAYIQHQARRECGVVLSARRFHPITHDAPPLFKLFTLCSLFCCATMWEGARVFSASVTTTFVTCPFPRQTIIKSTPTGRNFKSLISPSSSSWTGKACYFSNKRTAFFHFNILSGTVQQEER